MAAKPIPDGYHTVTPYLAVRGAAKVIEFLKQAFGAEMLEIIKRPDGSIMHAEAKIGDSRVMIADESETTKATSSMSRVQLRAGRPCLVELRRQFSANRAASPMPFVLREGLLAVTQ